MCLKLERMQVLPTRGVQGFTEPRREARQVSEQKSTLMHPPTWVAKKSQRTTESHKCASRKKPRCGQDTGHPKKSRCVLTRSTRRLLRNVKVARRYGLLITPQPPRVEPDKT